MNCQKTHIDDLFQVVNASVGPSIPFGAADNTESVQMFATETVNNRPHVLLVSEFDLSGTATSSTVQWLSTDHAEGSRVWMP